MDNMKTKGELLKGTVTEIIMNDTSFRGDRFAYGKTGKNAIEEHEIGSDFFE